MTNVSTVAPMAEFIDQLKGGRRPTFQEIVRETREADPTMTETLDLLALAGSEDDPQANAVILVHRAIAF